MGQQQPHKMVRPLRTPKSLEERLAILEFCRTHAPFVEWKLGPGHPVFEPITCRAWDAEWLSDMFKGWTTAPIQGAVRRVWVVCEDGTLGYEL
jgi:hypothetical protein